MAKEKTVQQGKVNSSIVYRLNTRLFFRMLGIFFAVDLLVCLLFAVGITTLERQSAEIIIENHRVGAEAGDVFEGNDYLRTLGYEFFGEASEEGFLSADWSKPGILEKLDTVQYNFEAARGEEAPVYVSVDMGRYLVHFAPLLLALCIMEIFILIGGLFKNARTIKGYLRPLEELALTASSLNSELVNPRYLRKLEGTLDSIDADRLDTRIPVGAAKAELKSLTEAINGMLDRVDGAYKSQMRFVSDASHELRTPIAVIQGYASLLDRWGKDDPQAMEEAIGAIKTESNAMKEMVEQLLFLARGDNQSIHLDFEDVNINDLAKEVFHEVEMMDKVHFLEGAFLVEEASEQAMVWADAGLMKQLMRILIDNSLKYTPENKSIKISAKREGENVIFSVQDEGIGIPQEALPFIFDRFYRADESRARKTGGTGLGLSIAKWITEKHEGHLEVLTRENIGTRFQVVLRGKTAD